MPAEAWVALAALVATMEITVIGAVWYLSSQMSKVITRAEITDTTRSNDISRLNEAVERIEVTVSAIAVDRANVNAIERRVATLERWYDELRRGVGRIEPHPA